MKKIILCLLGIFTLFSLSSCKSQCNCLGCQDYKIIKMEIKDGPVYNAEIHDFEQGTFYRITLKSEKQYIVSEETYNSYKIGDIYEGEKD